MNWLYIAKLTALAIIISVVLRIYREYKVRSQGVKTDAIVVNRTETTDSEGVTSYAIELEYTIDGCALNKWLDGHKNKYINDVVPIIYSKSNPLNFVIDNTPALIATILLSLIASGILIFLPKLLPFWEAFKQLFGIE